MLNLEKEVKKEMLHTLLITIRRILWELALKIMKNSASA